MNLIIMMTLCFIFSSHPAMMILLMILITLTLNMYMYMYMKYTWLMFMITLLILGGLLVIFLYITSLTPNKKFSLNKIFYYFIPLTLLVNFNPMMYPNNYTMSSLFMPMSALMLIFMLIYLMLTLVSIMNMIKSSMAPLKMN
nr:NADH dehydrogenase subunit 6 [Alectorobius spheniscus]